MGMNMKRKVIQTYKKEKPILVYKQCIFKDCKQTSVSVHGENPYCRHHTENQCCLQYTENIFNEKRCNAVCGMVEFHGKKYCNAHYRTLISKCNHPNCIKSRNTNEVGHDLYWYCKKHKPDHNNFLANISLSLDKKKIPFDISNIIHKKLKKHKSFI